jgi:DNA-binding transcriptional MerR regulator
MNNPTAPSCPIGTGIYTVKEAARYTSISAYNIRSWLFGYRALGTKHPGLWTPQLSALNKRLLSFNDLLEVRLVQAFHQHGVSLPAIRSVTRQASEMFNRQYPLSCRQFTAHGRRFCARALDETGDEALLDMVKRQWVYEQVIKPSLYAPIDYSSEGTAQRWYPLQRSKIIVLDPMVNLGKPVVAQCGVATSAIYDAFQAVGRDIKRVARMLNVPYPAVYTAVFYEARIAA